jgi:hypothetical protein
MPHHTRQPVTPEMLEVVEKRPISRRTVLKLGALGLGAAATFGALEAVGFVPKRQAQAAPPHRLPNIQFDIGKYIAPVQSINGIPFHFGPVYTLFLTATLTRTPTRRDQQALGDALERIEQEYDFSPSGVFTFVAYGIPYFNRLPGGMQGHLVASHMPRLLADTTRYALEEAVPSPTDVSLLNPGITKKTFQVPVKIEANDVLFTLRSDEQANLLEVAAWLQGYGALAGRRVRAPDFNDLFRFTSARLEFAQIGLPRKLADRLRLPYASRINPNSPMWMGFLDQQVDGAGPAPIVTFQGNASARFTTARPDDYFADGAIQHLSHNIEDLQQFYADDEPYTERCQYMFRSNPIPSTGNTDQFTDGGGPAALDNIFQGADDALHNAQGIDTFQGEHRMGHLCALQRSSRAADGTPVHIRMDGPGYDALDVPDGSSQPKLQFTIFVPTADFFTTMRRNQAALDLVHTYGVADEDNGLERFITATRRQNFLVPPRAHRAFPLVEGLH